MDNHTRTKWVYTIHDKVNTLYSELWETCTDCAFYCDGKNYTREKLHYFAHSLCPAHIDLVRGIVKEAEELHFSLEHCLGINVEGYFRHLPDGRLCSMRSVLWRNHLLAITSS